MARYKSIGRKVRFIKATKQTKWAPFWTIPKIYGQGKRVHPSRHTTIKRHWKRTSLKV